MDSDSQLGCLGNFFKSRLRRIKPPRPKPSSQSRNSKATTIAPPGERKGRAEVACESQDSEAVYLDADQQKGAIQYFSPHCDYSCSSPSGWWSSNEPRPPSYSAKEPCSGSDNDASVTIERTLDGLNPNLRDLSLKIHGTYFAVII
jgi:hypothetical protein